ncbi:hypothetical protein QWZ13_04630 [Reinekea marina]|uniref:hypothetical protein n=1 Tax=Reinekea marina TaxID=1310421 RepID=UPI0025B419C5|nr:hypothetical protein [Reinekea marina]MDN3648191.1 hypothetical protein [Reinekea marina]
MHGGIHSACRQALSIELFVKTYSELVLIAPNIMSILFTHPRVYNAEVHRRWAVLKGFHLMAYILLCVCN